MLKRLALTCTLCLIGLVIPSRADTIGPNCGGGNCFGSTYTLGYITTGNPNVFDVYLLVNTTGYNQGSTDLLNAVSLKLVSQSSSITAVNLIGSPIPSGFSTTTDGGINSGGCSGNGGGFFCSESIGNGLEVAHASDIYLFEWQLTLVDANSLFLGVNQASVDALYVTSAGVHHGITSANITLTPGVVGNPLSNPPAVPEPSSLLLLGTGMVGVAAAMRRRLMS